MKRNLLMGFMVMTMTFANLTHANFTFYSSTPNACEYIAGQWAGNGKAYNWFIGTCVYHGSGNISTLDNAGNFSAEVTADKDSGNILCPNHTTKILTGNCHNGIVTFMTEYGDLGGSFSENTGQAKGTLSVGPGMNADVNIQFARRG